jgi:hypothetical protein
MMEGNGLILFLIDFILDIYAIEDFKSSMPINVPRFSVLYILVFRYLIVLMP